MANLPLNIAGFAWDHITPLLTGDVVAEGIDLQYDVQHGLNPVNDDPSCAGGEASLGKYLIGVSNGDRDYVGLPIFPMVQLRHRCFLVKRGTTVGDLTELEGKRVGVDGWPNSGNTWTRVILGQAGVDIWKIHWVIAPVEEPTDDAQSLVPAEAPPNVEGGPPGKSLVDLLLSGEIDVLVTAWMPAGFYSPESPVVPMIPDYRSAEEAYYREHGYIPAHHLIKVRREIVERDPWIAQSLMTAFTDSKQLWFERRRRFADTVPLLLSEFAEAAAVFGDDWQPYGLEPNLKMLGDLCQDQYAQKLVDVPADPATAFADFTSFTQQDGQTGPRR